MTGKYKLYQALIQRCKLPLPSMSALHLASAKDYIAKVATMHLTDLQFEEVIIRHAANMREVIDVTLREDSDG